MDFTLECAEIIDKMVYKKAFTASLDQILMKITYSLLLRLQIFHPALLLGSPRLSIWEDFPSSPLIMASPFIRDLRVSNSFQMVSKIKIWCHFVIPKPLVTFLDIFI